VAHSRARPKELPIPLNSAVNLEPTEALTAEPAPKGLGLILRDTMVVLTQDASLINAVKTVSSPERELLFVSAETDLATQLLASGAGVAVLDSAATVSSIGQLTHSLKVQFPDLVLIVAGGAAEQSALTTQVSNGEVYRFLHKPASEQRVRLFVDAAWRRREKGDGATTTVQRLPDIPDRRTPLGLIVAAALGVAALAGLAGWLMGHHGTENLAATAPAPAVIAAKPAAPPAPQPAVDTTLKDLLARADAALARGDWVMPAGGSAADLYRQALEHHPGDALALAGIDKVVDQLLGAAEQDLLAQHFDEAEHMTEAARTLAPNSPRIAFLTTQLAREHERVTRAQAHQQAQQQQADALAHQQELIAGAQSALKAGKLNDAAQALDAAVAAGAGKDAVEALRRDLQSARANALVQETVVKPAPPAASTEAALATQSPAQPQPQAQTQTAPATAALAVPPASLVPEPKAQPDESGSANVIVNAATLERLQYIAPEYPTSAREQGTSGWVQLAFDVEKDGSVAHIAVLGSDPKYVFDEAAIAALRRWRYRPVQKNGQAVEQRAQLRIRFALQ
jgi:protein TonB